MTFTTGSTTKAYRTPSRRRGSDTIPSLLLCWHFVRLPRPLLLQLLCTTGLLVLTLVSVAQAQHTQAKGSDAASKYPASASNEGLAGPGRTQITANDSTQPSLVKGQDHELEATLESGSGGAETIDEVREDLVLERIAFGSCNKHDRPQPLWKTIYQQRPDLWVWLGDVVYADTRKVALVFVPSPLSVMRERFNAQKMRPEYQLLANNTPIIGVWDDHDFGINNGGGSYFEKDDSKHIFLDFLGIDKTHPRRERAGLYASHTYGPPGKRVKIILLDVRYSRDDPHTPNADILGEEQWKWLEKELNNDAQINIIGSGIQVFPLDKPIQEKWGVFPACYDRLLNLIETSNASGVVLLSGDVHYAQIFKSLPHCQTDAKEYLPVYEVTSSGMTHSCATQSGFLCRPMLRIFMRSMWEASDFYENLNFGTIEIDWQSKPITLTLSVRGIDGTPALQQKVYVGQKEPVKAGRCIPPDFDKMSWRSWHMDFWVNGLMASAVVLFLLAIGATFACVCHRRKRNKRKQA